MPQVNYVYKAKGINVTKNFPTPKRITEIRYWLKAAKVALGILYDIGESEGMASREIGQDGWFVATSDIETKYIRFNLEDKFGNRAQMVINRNVGGLGY